MSDEAEEVVTGLSIDDATPDSSVGGGELIPVSDAGSPKSVTVGQIKDFVLAKIAELTDAGAFSVNDDSVFILRGGVLKPVDADVLAAALFNEAFGRAGVAAPNGNEVIAVKDSTARKTLTLAQIKTWLQANMTVTPDLTLSTAGAAGTLGDSDLALVVQAASGKKVTLATLKDYVLGKLAAFITAQTAAQTVASSDVVLIVQGGNVRKATVAQLLGNASGGVTGPDTTTEHNIPQWDSTTKKLKNGLALTQTVNGNSTGSQVPTAAAVHAAVNAMGDVKKSGTPAAGTLAKWDSNGKVEGGPSVVNSTSGIADAENASDEKVPTEKAVRDAINDAAGVGAPETPVEGNVPLWDENTKLTSGMSVQQSVRNTATASHEALATEKAVRTAMDGLVAMPVSHTENAIPQWGSGPELKAGKTLTTSVASSTNASNDKIPTEKAVRDAIPGAATQSDAGLMSATDKTKLDGMADFGALAEANAALGDSDTVVIKKGDSTWKKSLLSRFWTYIESKLSAFRIDDLAEGEDNADLDTSTSRHGLCPKLSGSTSQFLRGDGTFATPPGMSPFTGTDGSAVGTNGLVPAPATTDENKFLNADGTWKSVAAAAAEDVAPEVLALTHYDTIFVPAAAMCPSASNGATPDSVAFTNTKRDTVKFGTVYDESCEFDLVLPDDWDKGSMKAKFLWTVNDSSASANTNVKWAIGCISTADGGAVSTAPTTFTDVTDAISQVNNLQRTVATAAFSPDGTTGDGNLLHFVVKRNNASPPSSPLTKDALLLGVWIQFAREGATEVWS